MIRLRRTFPVARVDAPRFVAAVPLLLQRFRGLTFNDDGFVETEDGRVLHGLRVIEGTHPRPPAGYTIVPAGQDPATVAEYAVELVADDARVFRLRGQEYGGSVEVLLTLPDPRRPTRIDLTLTGQLDEAPVRGSIEGSATVALDRFPPAHDGEPQLRATFRHRRLAGKLAVTITPDTDASWLATIEVRARFRGVLLLAAPLSPIIRRRLQRELDKLEPNFNEVIEDLRDRFVSSPDPAALADAAMDALLTAVAEEVPREDEP